MESGWTKRTGRPETHHLHPPTTTIQPIARNPPHRKTQAPNPPKDSKLQLPKYPSTQIPRNKPTPNQKFKSKAPLHRHQPDYEATNLRVASLWRRPTTKGRRQHCKSPRRRSVHRRHPPSQPCRMYLPPSPVKALTEMVKGEGIRSETHPGGPSDSRRVHSRRPWTAANGARERG